MMPSDADRVSYTPAGVFPMERVVAESARPWAEHPAPADELDVPGGWGNEPEPLPPPPSDPRAAREMIYEVEHLKAAYWARMLIWGSGAAWALTIFAATIATGPPGAAVSFQSNDLITLASLLAMGAFLVATLVVTYLMVNQRELIESRAHAAGAAAVARYDRRQELLGAPTRAPGATPDTAGAEP